MGPRSTWKQIARGATSTIFLTECSQTPVAVKEIDANIRNVQQYLDHLAQILPLNHPNITRVSDCLQFDVMLAGLSLLFFVFSFPLHWYFPFLIPKLFGTCNVERPLIFMEYVANGNLFNAMQDPEKRKIVSWQEKGRSIQRYNVYVVPFLLFLIFTAQ